MTALLYYIETDRLCVAMDTRTLDIDDATGARSIGTFCSKMFMVPHLRGLICGTGIGQLPFLWHAFVQQNTVACDIAGLDQAAALTLPGLAQQCGVDADFTATIYHFGYSVAGATFIARAFRSTDGFKPEPLEVPAFGFKPHEGMELSEALGLCEKKGLPDGFVEVMKTQKALDDARPPQERLGIGGEVQFLVMTPDDYSLRTCHRFKDYDSDLVAIMDRARRDGLPEA